MTDRIPLPDPDTLTNEELASVVTKLAGLEADVIAHFERVPPDHPERPEVEFIVAWVHQSREILRRKLDGRLPKIDDAE